MNESIRYNIETLNYLKWLLRISNGCIDGVVWIEETKRMALLCAQHWSPNGTPLLD